MAVSRLHMGGWWQWAAGAVRSQPQSARPHMPREVGAKYDALDRVVMRHAVKYGLPGLNMACKRFFIRRRALGSTRAGASSAG